MALGFEASKNAALLKEGALLECKGQAKVSYCQDVQWTSNSCG